MGKPLADQSSPWTYFTAIPNLALESAAIAKGTDATFIEPFHLVAAAWKGEGFSNAERSLRNHSPSSLLYLSTAVDHA
jgi:hypothetical protein